METEIITSQSHRARGHTNVHNHVLIRKVEWHIQSSLDPMLIEEPISYFDGCGVWSGVPDIKSVVLAPNHP
jgi:hypothetical protein